MNICIYGVGRSGTKFAQLAAILSVAKPYCDVNYEPFMWSNRYGKERCKRGIEEHISLPLIVDDLNISGGEYIKNICTSSGDIPMVSKFIRANGRIRFIYNLVHPDKSILIIRSLFEIINSLKKCNFDFVSKEQPINEFDRLPAESNLAKKYSKYITTQEDKNALWWLIMNEVAIRQIQECKDFSIVNYNDINTFFNINVDGLDIGSDMYMTGERRVCITGAVRVPVLSRLSVVDNIKQNDLYCSMNGDIFELLKGITDDRKTFL